jgi:hypothetical protein
MSGRKSGHSAQATADSSNNSLRQRLLRLGHRLEHDGDKNARRKLKLKSKLSRARGMSAFSSLLGKTLMKGRAGPGSGDHSAVNALRYALETMPRDKGFHLEPTSLRRDVFSELYAAFWGPYAHFFLPPNVNQGPALLSDVQQLSPPSVSVSNSRSCARILAKGECCYRCKWVT